MAFIIGRLGAAFGRMGVSVRPGVAGEPPDFTPSLDFSDARNSQYIGQVV